MDATPPPATSGSEAEIQTPVRIGRGREAESSTGNGRWPARHARQARSRERTHKDADAASDDNIASVVSCRCSKAANAADNAPAVESISRAKASSGSAK